MFMAILNLIMKFVSKNTSYMMQNKTISNNGPIYDEHECRDIKWKREGGELPGSLIY